MTPKPKQPNLDTEPLMPAPDSGIPYGMPVPKKRSHRRGVPLGLRIPADVFDHLGAVSDRTGITRSRLLADALRDYLPRIESLHND